MSYCIMPIHGHCTLMYPGLLYLFPVMCKVVSLYSANWMAGSSTAFFITSLLGWNYNVFWPLYHPSDLTHQVESVTADFTTHGGSHLYGLLYPFVDSLDPMDHFCTLYVSNIIPKNMHYFLYATFKPLLTYIHGYDPQTCIHRDV